MTCERLEKSPSSSSKADIEWGVTAGYPRRTAAARRDGALSAAAVPLMAHRRNRLDFGAPHRPGFRIDVTSSTIREDLDELGELEDGVITYIDEGLLLAHRLQQAGIDTTFDILPGGHTAHDKVPEIVAFLLDAAGTD